MAVTVSSSRPESADEARVVMFTGPCADGARCTHVGPDAECPLAVQSVATFAGAGPIRWFVTFGHPAFNSVANNGGGYATERAARAAVRRCSRSTWTVR